LVDVVRPVVVDMRKLGWQNLDNTDYAHLERILNRIYQNVDELNASIRLDKKAV
jgi:hypothetical protein